MGYFYYSETAGQNGQERSQTLEIARKVETAQETAGQMVSDVLACTRPFIWGCLAIVEGFTAAANGQIDFWATFDFTSDL